MSLRLQKRLVHHRIFVTLLRFQALDRSEQDYAHSCGPGKRA